ncbi:MAG: FKBP-type peptidyl-prolyl cis-trans isomerase [Candidatus Gracilibacteria bacterium]|nr:FKBP-type peptidyl-prolyl cis-trans isomerase [Candidatus Gracilibacteria bacterium]
MRILSTLVILSLTLGLSSCFQEEKNEAPTASGTVQTGSSESGTVALRNCTQLTPMDENALNIWKNGVNPAAGTDAVSSGKIVSVNYTLRTCTADGTILDTSREADAKLGGIYSSGRTYEPFQTIIGSHQTVRGFEYGLIGMKKGERKTIAVAASDGYAEEKIPKYYIAPNYTMTLDKSLFADKVTQVVNRGNLGEMSVTVKVGDTLTGGTNGEITAKVINVTDTEVTLDIDNSTGNPFHGQELKAGATAEVQSGVTFTVKAIKGNDITFDVVNEQSPFIDNFMVGATAEVAGTKMLIKAIEEDNVIIEDISGTDPKKTSLFFDVEIVDIK